MNRRHALSLLAPTILSGCLSTPLGSTDGENETAASTPSESPTPTASPTPSTEPLLAVGETHTTAEGRTLSIDDVVLRRSLLNLWVPDAVTPLTPGGMQFVFLTIPIDGSDALVPETGSFRLLLDDDDVSHTGAASAAGAQLGMQLAIPNDDVHPSPETAREKGIDVGSVVVEVPLHTDPERVVIEWKDGDESARWRFDDELVRKRRNPPEFRVEKVELAEEFGCGEPFDASVTIANDGGRTDVFHAIFPATEPTSETIGPPALDVTVPAGETVTWDGELEYPPQFSSAECDGDIEQATFELDWGTGSKRVTIDRKR